MGLTESPQISPIDPIIWPRVLGALPHESRTECSKAGQVRPHPPFVCAQAIFLVPESTRLIWDIARLLVGEGARSFALDSGLECVTPESLVCPRAKHEWEIWKARLDATIEMSTNDSAYDPREIHKTQDTVGAVAWDTVGHLTAGVSRFVWSVNLTKQCSLTISRAVAVCY